MKPYKQQLVIIALILSGCAGLPYQMQLGNPSYNQNLGGVGKMQSQPLFRENIVVKSLQPVVNYIHNLNPQNRFARPCRAIPTCGYSRQPAATTQYRQSATKHNYSGNTTSKGQKVLDSGNRMVVNNVPGNQFGKDHYKGSCWAYIEEVYRRAGFPKRKRSRAINRNKVTRNFASINELNQIQPGDWVYFNSYDYGRDGGEHSGIFISWIDQNRKEAKLLSYPGRSRKEPGNYKNYRIHEVWRSERPK